MLNTHFSGSLEFCFCVRQRGLLGLAPNKNSDCHMSKTLPQWIIISDMLSQLIVGGIKYIHCNSTSKEFLEAPTWFPLGFAL